MIKTPNFIFLGPDKAGSTWIHRILNDHSECFVPQKVKETFFFNRYYQRGFKWYLSFFEECPSEVHTIGEVCHDYLFSRPAAERIKNYIPEVKLLTCLRNPAERSFSQYLYLVRSGITRKPFSQALREIPRLIDNSLYYKHLSYYFDLFEPSQIKVLYFDNLKADPPLFARELFSFLDVDYSQHIDYLRQALPASRPRSFLLARLAKIGANFARRLSLEEIVGHIKTSNLIDFLYLPYKTSEKPEMGREIRHELIQIFLKDIQKLEQLLNKDFSHWVVVDE